MSEQSGFVLMDLRTGRPAGDHGTAEQAIRYTLDDREHDYDSHNQLAFLKCWTEGDLEEWPEYYEWLKDQAQ